MKDDIYLYKIKDMTKYNKDELINLIVIEKLSYEEIGRKYEVSGNAIKKAAKRFGIKLEQRRKINENETFNKIKKEPHYCEYCGKELEYYYKGKRFCDNICQSNFKYQEFIKKWKNGEENGSKGLYDISAFIRRYLFEKYNNKCQKCGWNVVNPYTGKIPLQVHHIDGDCTNNNEDNLQLLCPNCHSLTDTFGNGNKISKRVYRRQKGNI